MNLNYYVTLKAEFELALETFVEGAVPEDYRGMLPMLRYHLGWEGEGAGLEAQGKRIRPMLVLLCCLAGGGSEKAALPAALAVELVHNFSLVHDDIQDNSPLRRGRPTLWVKWGAAQAINAGDLLFNLAYSAVVQAGKPQAAEVTLQAVQILAETCTRLTGGQYLDLSYEKEPELTLAAYWPMIAGKTAALLSCCAELGALYAGKGDEDRGHFRVFGQKLGMAFQAWDDWLGIWGDSALTGKSAASDLMTGKKTLPVLFGIAQKGEFAGLWKPEGITAGDVLALSEALIRDGAQAYVESKAAQLTKEALEALDRTTCDEERCLSLKQFVSSLLYRKH